MLDGEVRETFGNDQPISLARMSLSRRIFTFPVFPFFSFLFLLRLLFLVLPLLTIVFHHFLTLLSFLSYTSLRLPPHPSLITPHLLSLTYILLHSHTLPPSLLFPHPYLRSTFLHSYTLTRFSHNLHLSLPYPFLSYPSVRYVILLLSLLVE